MGLLWEGFYGVIFFGEEGWGGFTLNFLLYRKPVANNKGPFFYVSRQITGSAGFKMKSYTINWKSDLPPQL